MKILVACEESQAVTIELRKLGHEAYSCDIIECSGGHPEWHIQDDVLKILNPSSREVLTGNSYDGNFRVWTGITFKTMDGTLHIIEGKWDLIIAHPPCTYMSKAGARWMYPTAGNISQERLAKAMKAKEFFLKILNADCDRIAIENPRPLKVVDLPKPSQVIQPYQFGHPYSKATCLWLKGLSPLEPTDVLTEYNPYCPSNTGGVTRGQSYNKGGAIRAADDCVNRSKTFDGIAKAMAEQWGGECD